MSNCKTQLPLCDFVLTYHEDGKTYNMIGKAKTSISQESDYEEVYPDGYSMPTAIFKTSSLTTLTLECVPQDGTHYRIRGINEMEKVTTTRSVAVPDYTFASVSRARKVVGAPREATFELKLQVSKDYLSREEKVAIFTWEETL